MVRPHGPAHRDAARAARHGKAGPALARRDDPSGNRAPSVPVNCQFEHVCFQRTAAIFCPSSAWPRLGNVLISLDAPRCHCRSASGPCASHADVHVIERAVFVGGAPFVLSVALAKSLLQRLHF